MGDGALAWRLASNALSVRSSSGSSDVPASELLGVGPIAAPTTTPIANIAAASAALTRSEGVRGTPDVSRACTGAVCGLTDAGGSPGAAVSASAGAPVVGSGVSGVSVIAMDAGRRMTFGIIHHYSHKIPNVDQFYGNMLCSPLLVVNRSSNSKNGAPPSMSRIRRISLALAVAGVLGVAAPAAASAVSVITISGATASYPLVALLAQKYVKLYPHKFKFKIAQGGSQVGINDVAAGRVSIADVSREAEIGIDPPHLDFYPIAKYGICVITNKANTLSNLTQAQVTSIFTGKTRNWGQVPGATASGTIDLISRTSVAGVLTSFQSLMLEGKKVSSVATEESSEGLLKQQVENDPNAVGFVSNYQVDLGGVNSVGFKGVACNRASVASGQYEGVARFNEVTKGPATGAVGGFIHWIEVSAPARKIISTQWVPIK